MEKFIGTEKVSRTRMLSGEKGMRCQTKGDTTVCQSNPVLGITCLKKGKKTHCFSIKATKPPRPPAKRLEEGI